MARRRNLTSHYATAMHWINARLLGLSKPATGFLVQPEPRSIGDHAKGLQLKAGNVLFAGQLFKLEGETLWEVQAPDDEFLSQAHGFGWLDDLAAVGDRTSRKLAQTWVKRWIDLYGRGAGPGWRPDLTGRRLMRLIHHGFMVLQGQSSEKSEKFFHSLGRQTLFLSRRWAKAPPGLPRFEALAGLIYAGLTLDGMQRFVQPATRALASECRVQIDQNGAIPTRNPEELLDIFTLLMWLSEALKEANWVPSSAHLDGINRIAPTLRQLRHADGTLPRFHGGSAGITGRLDEALVRSGNSTVRDDGLAMGFARLSAGPSSLIMDASPPPEGRASLNAHASTLAFEFTSGVHPLIVNCGTGAQFGSEWLIAGRATPSHSTLFIEGVSSARLGPALSHASSTREPLINGAKKVPYEFAYQDGFKKIETAHDGYVPVNGLTHVRKLSLHQDGYLLMGEELLLAIDDKNKRKFDRSLEKGDPRGFDAQIRFHIHPSVDAELDQGGDMVSLHLSAKETWVFKADPQTNVSLEQSIYFETGRLKPRPTKQVVLSLRAMDYATRVQWRLSRPDMALADREA